MHEVASKTHTEMLAFRESFQRWCASRFLTPTGRLFHDVSTRLWVTMTSARAPATNPPHPARPGPRRHASLSSGAGPAPPSPNGCRAPVRPPPNTRLHAPCTCQLSPPPTPRCAVAAREPTWLLQPEQPPPPRRLPPSVLGPQTASPPSKPVPRPNRGMRRRGHACGAPQPRLHPSAQACVKDTRPSERVAAAAEGV